MDYRVRALCLATSLALVLGGCAGGSVTAGDADRAPVPTTLPPANAAIGMLRLAGSNGERWYLDGARDGAANDLVPVTGHNAFWFAWSVFHPGTEVWEGEATNAATIQQDPSGQCTVPCDDIFSGCPGRDCIPPLDSPAMVAADSLSSQHPLVARGRQRRNRRRRVCNNPLSLDWLRLAFRSARLRSRTNRADRRVGSPIQLQPRPLGS